MGRLTGVRSLSFAGWLLSFFGAPPCAAASDGAWELLMDVDESRINIKTSPF